MKKFLPVIFMMAFTGAVNAQNVQFHYDYGRWAYDDEMSERALFTSTVEMFKPDKWGNTFFFVDMDYKSTGVAAAYWELARELKFWDHPFSVHLEYNGGLQYVSNAYFLGGTYSFNSTDFIKGFTLSAMYKYIEKGSFDEPHNFQLTGTWYVRFAKNKMCTFSGFADFWRERTLAGEYTFLSEPQFWLHLNKLQGVDDDFKLSIGTEVELSYNFAGREGFYAIPTTAIRWDF